MRWQRLLSKIDFALIFVLGVALALRLHLLIATDWGIESDEAIVGLMAKHIVEGKQWPIFYYGQPYMGALEPILTAGLFWCFGISNVVLKLTPLIFAILHCFFVYRLAQRFTSRFGALSAALCTAIGPSTLIVWSTKPRGGFIELVVFGTVALIFAVDILRAEKPKRLDILGLGLLLGVGWWVNNQIVFYIAAIGIVFLVHFFRHFSFRANCSYLIYAVTSFLVGSYPFWYFNFFAQPRFQSWAVLGQRAKLSEVPKYLAGYFDEALPIIFGARRLWNFVDVFPGSSILAWSIHGICFVVVLTLALKQKLSRGVSVLIVFCCVVPAIFASSGFGWLSQEPRYLLPLYSVIFVLIGIVVGTLLSGRWFSRVVGVVLLGLVLALHLASNYWGGLNAPGEPFVYKGDRVSHDHSNLYKWLKYHRYNHIYTNYWIGYRVAFETEEKITFSRFQKPLTLRIPEYEKSTDAENKLRAPYVLTPQEAAEFSQVLTQRGYNFQRSQVSGYTIIHSLVPVSKIGRKVQVTPSMVKASHRPDWAIRAFDGDLGTRWGTGAPQTPGMYLEIDFPKLTDIAGIRLDQGFWQTDRSTSLMIEGQDKNGQWCVLADTRATEDIDIKLGRAWEFFFVPNQYKAIKVVQVGSKLVFDWSLAEVELFEPAKQ